jgi:hypothetical protein
LIFVLAGRPERKVYGLQLFHEGLAPRLILSVGRFEVRQTISLGFQDLNLRELVARTPPAQRHFFIEMAGRSRQVSLAGMDRSGTFSELTSFAHQLQSKTPGTLLVISTSIHLRRVRWCCQRIEGFARWNIRYAAVPEKLSPFRRERWWTRPDHWLYLSAEYGKLAAYSLRYG